MMNVCVTVKYYYGRSPFYISVATSYKREFTAVT